MSFESTLRQEIYRLKHERDLAQADAKVLAHAYTHDSRPPMDVVQRAYAYGGGLVPVDSDDEPTKVTPRPFPAVEAPPRRARRDRR